jgi:uncharacterized membrane protein YdbT with pleckstrin-like domain
MRTSRMWIDMGEKRNGGASSGEPRRLDSNVRLLWLFPVFLAAAVFWLVASLVYLALPAEVTLFGLDKWGFSLALVASIIILILIPISVWEHFNYINFTYQLTETDIIVREGVITRKSTVIPYSKIQDITTERNFVERMLGLATLEIETAGSSRIASETRIPGIANKDALIEEIMEIAKRSKQPREEEEGHSGGGFSEPLMGEMLKELKSISSKLDALQTARRGEKGLFEPVGKEEQRQLKKK